MPKKKKKLTPPPRDKVYSGPTYKFKTPCGSVYVTVCKDKDGYPIEVFCRMGKVGGCSSAFLESMSRTISVALRCGVDAEVIASQYTNINCPGKCWDDGEMLGSCAMAVGKAMFDVLGKDMAGWYEDKVDVLGEGRQKPSGGTG